MNCELTYNIEECGISGFIKNSKKLILNTHMITFKLGHLQIAIRFTIGRIVRQGIKKYSNFKFQHITILSVDGL